MAGTHNLSAPACRAARALLGWTVSDLVREAGVSPNTIIKVEAGAEVREATAARIVQAFTAHGVDLLNGDAPGARLRAAQ